MNDLKIFENKEFGEIRTVIKDGEPWFVGRDVALESTGKNDHTGLIGSESGIQRNGSFTCIDVARIQRQEKSSAGEESWTISECRGKMYRRYR